MAPAQGWCLSTVSQAPSSSPDRIFRWRPWFFDTDTVAVPGTTIDLTFDDVSIGDVNEDALTDVSIEGQLQIGIRGDVNLDGRVSILDFIKNVQIIVGKDAALYWQTLMPIYL